MIQFLVSILLLVLSLILIFVPGFVVSYFLVPKEKHEDLLWIIAPFTGIAVNVIILQNLVYLNIPLSKSSMPYFFTICIPAIVLFKKASRSFSKETLSAILCAFMALALHGAGYLIVGYRNYVGYGWMDQFNYTAVAQFLTDLPYRTGLNEIGHQVYLLNAVIKKTDRIGQSVLHGFFASVAHCNTKSLYGAVSLLSPFLTFLACWLVAAHLDYRGWKRMAVSFSAALMPGIAKIHLHCFLSNAFAIPFLLLFPIIIRTTLNCFAVRTLLLVSLMLAIINAVYTEFMPVFVVLLFLSFLLHAFITRSFQKKYLIGFISIIAIALIVNPFFIKLCMTILGRNALPNVLNNVYPFALTIEGITRFWFGFSFEKAGAPVEMPANFISLAFTFLAFAGVLSLLKRKADVVSGLIFACSVLPLLIFSSVLPYPYQYYKILLSISPLFIFGLWEFTFDEWDKIFPARIVKSVLLLLLAYHLFLTPLLSSFSKTRKGSSIVGYSHGAGNIAQYERLEKMQNEDILLSGSHQFRIAWMAYHGRNNRLWLMNDLIGDVSLKCYPQKFLFNDLGTLPDSIKVIDDGENYPIILPPEAKESIAVSIDNPQGLEKDIYGDFNWLANAGLPLKLEIFSLYKSIVKTTLSFKAESEMGCSDHAEILKVNAGNTSKQYSFNANTAVSYPLNLSPGKNSVYLTARFPKNAGSYAEEDSKKLSVKISGIQILVKLK